MSHQEEFQMLSYSFVRRTVITERGNISSGVRAEQGYVTSNLNSTNTNIRHNYFPTVPI
jgi:hypothetical protein